MRRRDVDEQEQGTVRPGPGDVEQAVEVGRRALTATVQTETTMGKVRLTALADRLPNNSTARTFREEIRAAIA
ncbi:hypothetical protein ACFU6K_12455 [Kitasatospora sp. NPDC057512]|uniref:hypothetical protein n=1 Tax=Kitasatospora sp. NPDC057512 TaxID=3346154 RepID=UPI00368FFF4D